MAITLTYIMTTLGISKFACHVEKGGHGEWSEKVQRKSYDYLYRDNLGLYNSPEEAREATDIEFAKRTESDRQIFSREVGREQFITTNWIVKEKNGEPKLFCKEYGNGVFLDDLLDKTQRYALETGDMKGYNPEEDAALRDMQRVLLNREATAVAYAVHHPDGVRYIPLLKWAADGKHIESTYVDVGIFFDRDIRRVEAGTIIDRLGSRFGAEVKTKGEENPYTYLVFRHQEIHPEHIEQEAQVQSIRQKFIEQQVFQHVPQNSPTEYFRQAQEERYIDTYGGVNREELIGPAIYKPENTVKNEPLYSPPFSVDRNSVEKNVFYQINRIPRLTLNDRLEKFVEKSRETKEQAVIDDEKKTTDKENVPMDELKETVIKENKFIQVVLEQTAVSERSVIPVALIQITEEVYKELELHQEMMGIVDGITLVEEEGMVIPLKTMEDITDYSSEIMDRLELYVPELEKRMQIVKETKTILPVLPEFSSLIGGILWDLRLLEEPIVIMIEKKKEEVKEEVETENILLAMVSKILSQIQESEIKNIQEKPIPKNSFIVGTEEGMIVETGKERFLLSSEEDGQKKLKRLMLDFSVALGLFFLLEQKEGEDIGNQWLLFSIIWKMSQIREQGRGGLLYSPKKKKKKEFPRHGIIFTERNVVSLAYD